VVVVSFFLLIDVIFSLASVLPCTALEQSLGKKCPARVRLGRLQSQIRQAGRWEDFLNVIPMYASVPWTNLFAKRLPGG
jgi:hypothetical protein